MSERETSARVRRGMFQNHPNKQPVDASEEDDISTDYSSDDDFDSDQEFDVECILAQTEASDGSKYYLVQWEVPKYDILQSTWEPQENIIDSSILDNWRDKKMRVLRSNEAPFDVEDFERRRLKYQQDQAERHRRKKQKRKKRGLPVSPSETEEETQSNVDDSISSIEAEEVLDELEGGSGLKSSPKVKGTVKKASRATGSSRGASHDVDSKSERRRKGKEVTSYWNEDETSDDSSMGELSRMPRQKLSTTGQKSKDQKREPAHAKGVNVGKLKHTRTMSQSSSDTPLAQIKKKVATDNTASHKRSSIASESRSLASQQGPNRRPSLEQRNSLLGIRTVPRPTKASKSVTESRMAHAPSSPAARGGRGAVRGRYGNVFSSRGTSAATRRRKTLTDKLIETANAPDTNKPSNHFSNMRMGWTVQKAGRQISDTAPDISALPGGLFDPSKKFQAFRPEDICRKMPATKEKEKELPDSTPTVSDRQEQPTNGSSYVPSSRDQAQDNSYNMICFYWYENGSCRREHDSTNPCKYRHSDSGNVPVAPRPQPVNKECIYWPTCWKGSRCDFYHPGEEKQQSSADGHNPLMHDRSPEMRGYSAQTSSEPLNFQGQALTRREYHNESHRTQSSSRSNSYQNPEICRYGSNCRNGTRCHFSHPERYSTLKQNETCRHFLRGNCDVTNCNFVHPEDTRAIAQTHVTSQEDLWAETRNREGPRDRRESEQEMAQYPASRTSKRVSFADDQAMDLCEEPDSLFVQEIASATRLADQTKSGISLSQGDLRPLPLLTYNQVTSSTETSQLHLPDHVPLPDTESSKTQPSIHQTIASIAADYHTDSSADRRGSASSIPSAASSDLSDTMPPRKLSLQEYHFQKACATNKGIVKKATLGESRKQLLILKFDGFDLSRDLPSTRSFASLEQLDFTRVCIAQDFQYQQTALSYEVFGQGNLSSAPENMKEIDALAEYLKSSSSGIACVKDDFIVLLYHSRCEEWKFLETGSRSGNSHMRYMIFQTKEKVDTTGVTSNRVRQCQMRRHSGNLKLSFYLGVLITTFMKLSFTAILPHQQVHKRPLFYIMYPEKERKAAEFLASWILAKRSDSKIYSNGVCGSWDHFVNASASSKSVFFYESAITALFTTPSLSTLIDHKTQTTSFWLIEDFSLGFPRLPLLSTADLRSLRGTTAIQILPLYGAIGGAILLTPSFIIAEPEKLLEFLSWFQSMVTKSPSGLWKLVCCSDIRNYLLDLAIEKAGELKQFKLDHREDDAMDANALKKGLSHEKCSQRFEVHNMIVSLVSNERSHVGEGPAGDDELSDAPKQWSGVDEETQPNELLSSIIYADSTINGDDEKGLITWFADWSIGKIDEFRRFIVIGTSPEQSDRAYRMKYHLRRTKTATNDNPSDDAVGQESTSKKLSSTTHRSSSLSRYGHDGTTDIHENKDNNPEKVRQWTQSLPSNFNPSVSSSPSVKNSARNGLGTLAMTGDGKYFVPSPHLHLLPPKVGEIIPTGTVLLAHSGYNGVQKRSQMHIMPGDSIKVMHHVVQYTYYGINLTKREEGVFSSKVFWMGPDTTFPAISGVLGQPGWMEVHPGDLIKVEKGHDWTCYVGTNRTTNEFGKFPDTILGPIQSKQEKSDLSQLSKSKDSIQSNLSVLPSSNRNLRGNQTQPSGSSYVVIPNGSIRVVKEHCEKTNQVVLAAHAGDEVEILKHVSHHMYYCRNLMTEKTGQISDSVLDEGQVKGRRRYRKQRRIFQRLPTEKGALYKIPIHVAKNQVCAFYNEFGCTYGSECIRRHICCECGSREHGFSDCPGPVYEEYSDSADETDMQIHHTGFDGADDSGRSLASAGIETRANGSKIAPHSIRSTGSIRSEQSEVPVPVPLRLEATTSWYEKQKAGGKAWEHLYVDRWENSFRYIDEQLGTLAPKK